MRDIVANFDDTIFLISFFSHVNYVPNITSCLTGKCQHDRRTPVPNTCLLHVKKSRYENYLRRSGMSGGNKSSTVCTTYGVEPGRVLFKHFFFSNFANNDWHINIHKTYSVPIALVRRSPLCTIAIIINPELQTSPR